MTSSDDDANLQAARASQVLAYKVHTEVVAPANPPLDLRMNAFAVLSAELAVSNTDSMEMAQEVIDTIAQAAKSALPLASPTRPTSPRGSNDVRPLHRHGTHGSNFGGSTC